SDAIASTSFAAAASALAGGVPIAAEVEAEIIAAEAANAAQCVPTTTRSPKSYPRVKPRASTRAKVWRDNIEASTGRVRDPVSGRFMGGNKAWDSGHRPGYELPKAQESAARRGITDQQWRNEQNDPDIYRPELPGSNR